MTADGATVTARARHPRTRSEPEVEQRLAGLIGVEQWRDAAGLLLATPGSRPGREASESDAVRPRGIHPPATIRIRWSDIDLRREWWVRLEAAAEVEHVDEPVRMNL